MKRITGNHVWAVWVFFPNGSIAVWTIDKIGAVVRISPSQIEGFQGLRTQEFKNNLIGINIV